MGRSPGRVLEGLKYVPGEVVQAFNFNGVDDSIEDNGST
jgi:hypothetical protein